MAISHLPETSSHSSRMSSMNPPSPLGSAESIAGIDSAWGAVSVVLKDVCSFNDIKDIVGLAGMNRGNLAHLVQSSGTFTSKGELITAIDKELRNFDSHGTLKFLNIVVEEMFERISEFPREDAEERLKTYLVRLGWQLVENKIVPIKIIDWNDITELDHASTADFLKAATRLRDGDLSGALLSACGAVDSVTTKIYQRYDIGNPKDASFQERCKVSLQRIGFFETLNEELISLGWDKEAITPLKKNLEGSINRATFVMQSLRSNMSDAHGTKHALIPLVFDGIKWAQILVRLLSEHSEE